MEIEKYPIGIGFLTVPLAPLSLEKVAKWGGENGFNFMELAAWPERTSRTGGEAAYVANHLGDVSDFTQARADDVIAVINGAGMKGISSLAFYENMLAADPDERAFYHTHLKRLISAAGMLGVNLVGTFPGRHSGMTVEESLAEYGRVFPDLAKFASDNGVRLMFENCPMEGWIPGKKIGNIACCPANWRKILEMTPGTGLNMDPSHLIWQDIDYVRAVIEFGGVIMHAHGKDAKLLDAYETGTFGEGLPKEGWGAGLYEHRIPGQGDVDWGAFTDALREINYRGVLSVELEAPQYKPRESVELSMLGLATARQNLLPHCLVLP
jgi:sugar phosphate isomerase/epimerase